MFHKQKQLVHNLEVSKDPVCSGRNKPVTAAASAQVKWTGGQRRRPASKQEPDQGASEQPWLRTDSPRCLKFHCENLGAHAVKLGKQPSQAPVQCSRTGHAA